MKWYQAILTYAALANMIVMPTLAHAQAADYSGNGLKGYSEPTMSATPFNNQTKYGQPKKQSNPEVLKMSILANSTAVLRNAADEIVLEAPFGQEAQLRRFEPKSLNKALAEEMARIKASGKAAYSHSVKALPTESAIFFMAMGAVVAGQLLLNYSANPLAMQQHIEHHMSPLGTFGFFTFMMSQGITSNMLSMYIKNPKMHFMIPYMGMAVGAFTQTYLTQLLADPNVGACAKTWLGTEVTEKDLAAGIDADPCSKAYEYLVVNKKIWEFAPGMISVVLSAGIAAGAQWALTKTLIKTVGIDIGLYLIPGKMQLTGLRMLLVKGLQIGAFGAIDVALNRWVTTQWKNVVDGSDFNEINQKLVFEINKQKQSGWSAADKSAEKELKRFNKKMSEWRMMNMSEIYESHQSWSDNIQRLMQMYNSSEAFYGLFVDQVRNNQFEKSYVKPLNISYPLNGVKASGLVEGKEDLYFTMPKAMEPLQLETISETVKYIDALYAEKGLAGYLLPHEEKVIRDIRNRLAGESLEIKVSGLEAINRSMTQALSQGTASRFYYETLYTIRGKLGAPVPLMEEGRGFLATYEKAPQNEQVVKGIPFFKSVGKFATPQLTDYFIMEMVCGPEVNKNQKSVQEAKGFYTLFVPPRINNSAHDFSDFCEVISNDVPRNNFNIYNTPLNQGGPYKGFLSYIKNNIRPEVLGDEKNRNFSVWWKEQTESQMIKAFENYEESYSEVIEKMITAVNTTVDRKTNMGPIANGAMESIIQEQRIYLAVLEDILQPQKSLVLSFKEKRTQKPKTEIGQKIERQFMEMHMLFNQIKVGKQGGKNVLLSDIENYQFEEKLKEIQTSLEELSQMTQKQALKERQNELAITALEGLQSIAMETMMYGTIANAVTWSKIRDLKRLDIERQEFNNAIQKKLAQIKGVSAIGGR